MNREDLHELAATTAGQHWPGLSIKQRDDLGKKFVDTWPGTEQSILTDTEVLYCLKSFEVQAPELFRLPPSPAQTKDHLLQNISDPQARMEVFRRVAAMSPDERLNVVPPDSFIYQAQEQKSVGPVAPPLTPTMSDDECFAVIATRMGLLTHEFQRLSAITRLNYLRTFRDSLPKAPVTKVTDEAIRKGAKTFADLKPTDRIAAYRESQQRGVTSPGLKIGEKTEKNAEMSPAERLAAYRKITK